MSKQKRTRLHGADLKALTPAITSAFTLSNFRALLAEGARPDARYTHQQIVEWSGRFWWTQSELVESEGGDAPQEIKAAADLAQEIEMQWDFYVANTYTLTELQQLDLSQVRLPSDWFTGWLDALDQLEPSTVSE